MKHIYFQISRVVFTCCAFFCLVLSAQAQTSQSAAHTYVGAKACASCHQAQFTAWQGSHHDLAMQHADQKSVLGDFNQARFKYNSITTTFFKRADRYYVNTDGPDGKMSDFEIKYTFGVDPLQQYLVELPGGRLQALNIAWDSRPKSEGGQRWFHLYPQEKIDYRDELHWSKLSQNWNYMCAECHSTNLKKNYNQTTNQFQTTWTDLNVSCEACHGPGSKHLEWTAKAPGWEKSELKGLVFLLDEKKGVSWGFNDETGIAKRSKELTSSKELNTCARCHSRRSTLTENYLHGKPLLDTHLPALLTEPLYYADGQINDEVYEYGSFVQSKMFHSGVNCSDCHEPHSLKLRAPGNQTCLQCHQTGKYNTEKHHFHHQNSKGASCIDCHMPTKNYMVIDARHDHSIRIPRPDLSLKLNTPNSCTNCHTKKNAVWANTQLEKWYGKDWSPGWHFAETLSRAGQNLPQAGQGLIATAASPQIAEIARATAIELLLNYTDRTTLAVLPTLLADKSPMIRVAALSLVDLLPPEQRLKVAGVLLSDPVLAVRIEAANVLAVVPRDNLNPVKKQWLNQGIQEYIQAQTTNAEHPQSQLNLGLLYIKLNDYQKAESSYQQALKLEPNYPRAYVNLADLYRSQNQEAQVEATLLKARTVIGDNSEIEHALGLHYIRVKEQSKALEALAKAMHLRPDNARYGLVYAVALNENGETKQALKILTALHDKHPYDRDVLVTLISYYKNAGDLKLATSYAEKLARIDPQYGGAEQILKAVGN